MIDINDGGPAFPINDVTLIDIEGLSIRQYFAAAALTGLIASPHSPPTATEAASSAFEIADAMIHFSSIPSGWNP